MRLVFAITLTLAVTGAPLVLTAQPPLPTTTRIPPYIDMLKRPAVREDLQVIPLQFDEIQAFVSKRSATLASGLTALRFEEDQETRMSAHRKMQGELLELEMKAYGMLLPFQRKRLDQIVNQVTTRASDTTAGLTHKDMVGALDLSERQLVEIRIKGAEIEARLNKKLAELREEMRNARKTARSEVLTLLSEDQRNAYKEINGEFIDINEPIDPTTPGIAAPIPGPK